MSDEKPPESAWSPRPDADKGREPHLIASQMGRRMISLGALAERIAAAFVQEHYPQSAALMAADTATKRIKLVLETTEYVIAVETASVSSDEKAELIRRVYSELFGYGPLDALLLDERVTTISLEGADQAAVRFGHDELTSLGPIFQNEADMLRFLRRMAADGGAELRQDQPYLEIGLTADGRPVCLNLLLPPAAAQITADIRVHPRNAPSADDLIASDVLTDEAAALLKALATSPHGIVIAGEPESGKTTLLSVLSHWLPQPERAVAVERAGELRLPAGLERLMPRWPVGETPRVTFGQTISRALALKPDCLLLDEVRADEPESIASLLTEAESPRQIWSFRGAIFAKRLQSALGMLARRADASRGDMLARALFERLPFVITLNRAGGRVRVWAVSEWQFNQSDVPDYTPLLTTEEGHLRLTGKRPVHALPLPDNFWT